MNNISDYSVGQIVYVKLIGNAARHEDKNNLYQEWIITKVGRRYIYAKSKSKQESWEVKFKQEPGKLYDHFFEESSYAPRYILYSSMEEVKDEEERFRLLNKFREYFYYRDRTDLTLGQLRTIDRVIKGEL